MRRSKRGGGGNTPKDPPTILKDALTATPTENGIELSLDMTQAPKTANFVDIYCNEDGLWEYWLGDTLYTGSKLEVTWPFVEAGKAYTFYAVFNGANTESNKATATATAGIGEMLITNAANLTFSYKDDGTIQFNEIPRQPNFSDNSVISNKYFSYTFVTGHNWDDGEWITAVNKDTPDSFDLAEESEKNHNLYKLSAKLGWVRCWYAIEYAGQTFYHTFASSEPFTFPNLSNPFSIYGDYTWERNIDRTNDPTLTANAIVYSIDSNGKVTVSVNETSSEEVWYIALDVHYIATVNSKYQLKFDCWSEPGDQRNISLYYGTRNSNEIRTNFDIDTTHSTYIYDLPEEVKSGTKIDVGFNCASQTGSFYIANLSITPKEGDEGDAPPEKSLPSDGVLGIGIVGSTEGWNGSEEKALSKSGAPYGEGFGIDIENTTGDITINFVYKTPSTMATLTPPELDGDNPVPGKENDEGKPIITIKGAALAITKVVDVGNSPNESDYTAKKDIGDIVLKAHWWGSGSELEADPIPLADAFNAPPSIVDGHWTIQLTYTGIEISMTVEEQEN